MLCNTVALLILFTVCLAVNSLERCYEVGIPHCDNHTMTNKRFRNDSLCQGKAPLRFTIKSLNASANCTGSNVLPNVTVHFDEGKTGKLNCGLAGTGIAFGSTLFINGMPEKNGNRFHINLLKKNGDIALHFNPRFDEKAIVRNSLIAGEWGNEEREGKIPFEKGVGFDLGIKNEEYAFQIFVNGERFASYDHRLEPHELHGLQIGGDVQITGIQMC
ncbi:Lectin, galactoside-binding, soluble [Parelaphostrongylus tenuis]|uniref:Galectin n=1 Tax=Parelaphostrongylus tenuis TaxID=148309 RepID=A0AAD5MF27_PARTN|nr:Lectin, galactoside-binding, soluble [Parelaphostrongylus tenuis]